MKRDSILFLIVLGVYLALAASFTFTISEHSEKYKTEKEEYVSVLKFQDRILSLKVWLFTESEWEKKKIVSDEQLRKSEQHYSELKENSYYVAALSIAFIAIVIALFWGKVSLLKMLGLSILTVAVVCLILGVFVPMLEIAAYSENLTVPIKVKIPEKIPIWGGQEIGFTKVFEGRTYYYYKSKSVLELIDILFRDGNLIVGISIVCFSVIVPAIKLLLSIITLLVPPMRRRGITMVIEKIGKWSMADVFVAAMFLAFLSFYNMNTGLDTESRTLVGLYFFLTYCVLSISSTYFIKLVLKKDEQALEEEIA
jgi:hypothetical protein